MVINLSKKKKPCDVWNGTLEYKKERLFRNVEDIITDISYTSFDELLIFTDLQKQIPKFKIVERNMKKSIEEYEVINEPTNVMEIKHSQVPMALEYEGITEVEIDLFIFSYRFGNMVAVDENGKYYYLYYKTLYHPERKRKVVYCVLYVEVRKKK